LAVFWVTWRRNTNYKSY